VQFAIKPSGIYVLMSLAVHLLALAAVFSANLPLWVISGLFVLILFNLLNHIYRHARAGVSWRSVTLFKDHLVVNTLNGDELNGELAPQTVVTPLCVVLCARLNGCRRPVCQVIFRDAMSADAFRELRVRLRFF
jgi:hypothetical protein